jgi:Xaa-Pro dipeptidase
LPRARRSDGDAVMQSARLIKFPEEIALMEEACAIAEALQYAAEEAIRPGARETDVVAEAMRELYRLGGELSHVTTPFVASGEHMAPPNRIPSDKIIREGDVVFVDIGAQWSGSFGDIGRTVICGKPRRQQEVYTAVYEGLAAATSAMKAGTRSSGSRASAAAPVRLEDTILVTADGGRALSRARFDERLLLDDVKEDL